MNTTNEKDNDSIDLEEDSDEQGISREVDGDDNDYAEDTENEEFATEGEELTDKIKDLRERLRACEKQRNEYLDGWQRAKADFVNSRRRMEEEKAQNISRAGEGIIGELLPIMDSFEMALADTDRWQKMDEDQRKGMEMIYAQLKSVFNRHGVEEIAPKKNEAFNPHDHEAMEMETVEDSAQDNTVQAVLQKGYRLQGRVLRAAKVKVGELSK